MQVHAYGAHAADKPLEPLQINRRATGAHDVQIDIAYCGICHSDLHQVRSEWAGTQYPCVPGHEIVGRVTAVGGHVSKFKVGDLVGVGCMVDSCQTCSDCEEGLENYCDNMVGTYNGKTDDAPGWTMGGYSQQIVVHERFVLNIRHPEADLAAVAPLLCAGITTYSPLRHWGAGPGKKIGVVGIGGLGHMGIKIAHAKSFDLILNTVAAPHDLDAFLGLLKRDGTMTLVGIPAEPHPSPSVVELIMKRRSLAGSLIGGIPETQEMLDFCARHGIVADIELIRAEDINTAYERMLKGDVKYRFVIDNASMAA
ncbi:NAD(P)-dependent alcohol dehydrogenase [Herbaspirillum sp. BH-1]|uniref:Zinc-type alcohol dehydrogenase-like protein n=1 Tax=Herbaspirillum frisingense TaxID=92645 RepID=A0ABU1PAI2_9BURK|nr:MULTISPECIES: NAD(P)-dependent alcohol dehydrogenase [Herbaspirillum]MDR6582937.1 putative zinc-type alcohol dehydrogenase-like protein [Herbaspirillum frisingense]PLY60483.1 NAD(P)-dependent alcohol dehydrogenase [Herbaspirillum sp. BH-1]